MTENTHPLAPFEPLIGGTWHAENSYQRFEWGVGKKMVLTKSYFLVESGQKLVSEGAWFYHPGRKEIKGHMAAIEMKIDLFTYTTRFEGSKMVSDLTVYLEDGGKQAYLETFDFTGEDRYDWVLFEKTEEGLKESMKATFTRKR